MSNRQLLSTHLVEQLDELSRLMKQNSFIDINHRIRQFDEKTASPELMVGLLRTTFAVRSLLSEWNGLLRRVRTELEFRGFNPYLQLLGLDRQAR